MKRFSLLVVIVALAGCPKKDAAPVEKPAGPPIAVNTGPTDADRRKAEMFERAVQVDAALGTYTHLERTSDVPPRKVELWRDGKQPAKLRVNDIAPDNKVAHTTEFYYTPAGRLAYVRHEQGLFMFDDESLVLFLDPVTQQIKRGMKPEQAITIGDDLKKTARTELDLFK